MRLPLRVQLYTGLDSDTGEIYAISPYTGDLLVCSPSDLEKHRRIHRLCKRLGVNFAASPHRETQVIEATPQQPEFLSSACRDQIRWACAFSKRINFFLHTLRLTTIANHIAALKPLKGSLNSGAVVSLLKYCWAGPDGKCLMTSFVQAGMLVRNGIRCRVSIGAWVPTLYMHAWTTVIDPTDEHALLVSDRYDRIMHYQPLLTFDF